MKTRLLLLSALFISALVGCSKENNVTNEDTNSKATNFSVILKGSDTKTTNGGAGHEYETLWAANDKINLFHAPTGGTAYVSDGQFTTTAGGSHATFTGTVEGSLTGNYDWYAIYPYSSYISSGTPANTDPGYLTIGSSKSGVQTQDGYNSTAHIAGNKYPIAGKVENVPYNQTPDITMNHISSLLKVLVTNNTGGPIAIRQIQFTSDGEPIVGNFYANITGANPSFTAVSEQTNTTAVLKVDNGTSLANSSSASFYLAIKPYTEASGNNLTLKVTSFTTEQEKVLTLSEDKTFSPGKVKTLNFSFTAVPTKATLPFSIDGTDGKAGYEGVDGLVVDNVNSSDYAAGHSPYLAKWDKDGSYLQLHYDVPAGKVSFGVKMIGGATTSHMHLKGSVDGISYSDIRTFDIEGIANTILNFETTSSEVPSTYRYLRLVFEKGSNIGFGPFSVALPSSDPVIIASDVVNVPAVGVTDATTTYTVENISPDDVTVSAVDGTIVTSASVTSAGTVTYSVAPNYTYTPNPRVGTITLNSPSKSVSKVINVNQSKSDLYVNGGTSNITVYIPNSGTTSTFTVTTKEFGWNTTVTPVSGKNLTISPTSGSANESAQTITVSSTTSGTVEEQTLGTIEVYRNDNTSDPQKRTITVKKSGESTGSYSKTTSFAAGSYLLVVVPANKVSTGSVSSNTLQATNVTITSNKINATSVIDGYTIEFEALTGDDAGYYALKNGGKYIGNSSSTNIASSASITNDNYKWSVSIVGNYVYIVNKGSGRYLGFNGTGGFKAYATSNAGSDKDDSGVQYARPSIFVKD